MCDDGNATALTWQTGAWLETTCRVKVGLRQRAGATVRVHRVVLLPFHLRLGDLLETGEDAAREHFWGCSLYVLCPVPHGHPPQSVLSHRLYQPSRIDRHQRLTGLVLGDLLPQEVQDKRLSDLLPGPVTTMIDAWCPQSQEDPPQRLRKGSRGDTKAGSQQVE